MWAKFNVNKVCKTVYILIAKSLQIAIYAKDEVPSAITVDANLLLHSCLH